MPAVQCWVQQPILKYRRAKLLGGLVTVHVRGSVGEQNGRVKKNILCEVRQHWREILNQRAQRPPKHGLRSQPVRAHARVAITAGEGDQRKSYGCAIEQRTPRTD